MVPQKGAPSLTGTPGSLDHVFGDARLRDFKPKIEQFAVDTRRSPNRVLDAHPPDQRPQVRINLRPSPPDATSNASNSESRHDASAPVSQVGQS